MTHSRSKMSDTPHIHDKKSMAQEVERGCKRHYSFVSARLTMVVAGILKIVAGGGD